MKNKIEELRTTCVPQVDDYSVGYTISGNEL